MYEAEIKKIPKQNKCQTELTVGRKKNKKVI